MQCARTTGRAPATTASPMPTSRAKDRKINCPTLLLWGSDYIGKGAADPLEVWRRWAPGVTGVEIRSGHFLAEENPSDTLRALLPFLTAP